MNVSFIKTHLKRTNKCKSNCNACLFQKFSLFILNINGLPLPFHFVHWAKSESSFFSFMYIKCNKTDNVEDKNTFRYYRMQNSQPLMEKVNGTKLLSSMLHLKCRLSNAVLILCFQKLNSGVR